MTLKDISGLNATLTISSDLFQVPYEISGFAEDDVISVDDVQNVNSLIGVDGNVSHWVEHVLVNLTITLTPNSPAIPDFMDLIAATSVISGSVPVLKLQLVLPGLGLFIFRDAALHTPILPPTVQKRLSDRQFVFTSRLPEKMGI